MRAPQYWRRRGLTAIALLPLSWVWSARVGRRMRRRPSHWASVPVICIGNYTSGGEGKTPTAIAIARLLQGQGLTPGFLTRGYGGTESGPLAVNDKTADPARIGDEPCLLAAVAPTVVSVNRPRGAELLVKQGVDVIIMDDGFQNPYLGKDLTLIVADGTTGFGNRWVMPAGPLRAPLRTQLALTDALVVVGEGAAQREIARVAAQSGKALFRARLVPDEPDKWRGTQVLAYAGIGRPEKFFDDLDRLGAHFVGRYPYPDHHRYTEADARALLAHADAGPIRLVTTEKDHIRLSGTTGLLAELRRRSEVFAVRMEFDPPVAVERLIMKTVAAVRGGTGRKRSISR